MELSRSVAKQFAAITNANKESKIADNTVYGEIVEVNGTKYAKIDGSSMVTPISTTANVKVGDRVVITLKNHTATVIGNMTDPSASSAKVTEIEGNVTKFETIIADKASIGELEAQNARIEELEAEYAVIDTLIAKDAEIENLFANYATIESLEATNATIANLDATFATIAFLEANYADINELNAKYATIEHLKANYADIEELNAKYATIANLEANYATIAFLKNNYASIDALNATNATIENLNTVYATIANLDATNAAIENLSATYANIDFANISEAAIQKIYSETGLIKGLTISEGKVTGELSAVTINGGLINAGTLKADRLLIKGEDGLYYQLNAGVDGVTEAQLASEEYQSALHGSNIIAHTITATQISVDDLVAFDATIGGFAITDKSLYSGVKSSVDNTTSGVYLDSTGQLAVGDASHFVKYYRNANGDYKLEITADNISLRSGSNVTSVGQALSDIGGRNLLENSSFRHDYTRWTLNRNSVEFVEKYGRPCVHIMQTSFEKAVTFHQDILSKLEGDTTYMASAWVLTENIVKGATNFFCRIYTGGNYDDNGTSTFYSIGTMMIPINTGTGEWQRITAEFRTDANILSNASECKFYIYTRDMTGDIYVSDLKLEKGTTVTEWTPAPEDVGILAGRVNIAETSIVQNSNAIKLKAAQSDLDTLIGRVADAETSITLNSNAIQLKAAQSDVDAIAGRVTAAESSITQNANSIKLKAAQTDLDALNNRVTNAETAIEQNSDAIILRATRIEVAESIDDITIGARNLLENSSFKYDYSLWALNSTSVEFVEKYGRSCIHLIHSSLNGSIVLNQNTLSKLEGDTTYTASAWVLTENIVKGTTNFFCRIYMGGSYDDNGTAASYSMGSMTIPINTGAGEWQRITTEFTTDSTIISKSSVCKFYIYTRDMTGDIYISELKLEKGNKATDWTAAPEDAARAGDMKDVQTSTADLSGRMTSAESVIQQLADSISMLVQDENGTSLMTQTSDGWVFSTAEIQDSVEAVSNSLDELTNTVGEVDDTVEKLDQAVSDLSEIAPYVKITTFEGEPCVELGEGDSDFKLLITNTRIMFKEGSSTPAYITNQSLYIRTAVIEDELQLGNFVWKIRSNGNLGLIWKG